MADLAPGGGVLARLTQLLKPGFLTALDCLGESLRLSCSARRGIGECPAPGAYVALAVGAQARYVGIGFAAEYEADGGM
jgi:hypothetical protein